MDKAVQPAPAGRRVHYERRRPEETTLYQLVQEHLETFLAQVELETGAGSPDFVKEEFDAFLECGSPPTAFCAQEKLVACEASIPGLAGNIHSQHPSRQAWYSMGSIRPTEGVAVFHARSAPQRLLIRKGYLIEEQSMPYLAATSPEAAA